MKRFLFFLLVAVFFLPILSTAQNHELIVPDDDYLNNTILNDVDDSGNRLDLDRIYVLKRGSTYYMNTALINTGFPLRLVAEEGDGKRPVIKMAQDEWTGNYPWSAFELDNHITLKGIGITGMPDGDDSYVINSIIWCNSPGYDIIIDDCILTDISGQIVRTQAPQRVVKITNSILGNIGFIAKSSFGTGKGIDFRDGSCDSAIVVNNTWVNIQSRIIRHRNGTAPINYLDFRYNTIINCMASDGVLELGVVGEKVKIKNNLLFNPFSLGRDLTDVNRNEFDGHGEKEDDGVIPKMVMLGSVPNEETVWEVANNYYTHTQEMQTWWGNNDLLAPYPMTDHVAGKLSNPSMAFIEEPTLTLGDIPGLPIELMDWYRSPDGANRERITTTEYDYDRRPYDYYVNTLDASYPESAAAYTGAVDGGPVGCRLWFNMPVGVKQEEGLPTEFALEQNYPNPFNPTTNIRFSIPESGFVTLKVFNVLGQEVATLVNRELAQGAYNFDFDASRLTSGTYLYSITSGNFTQAKKMLLVK